MQQANPTLVLVLALSSLPAQEERAQAEIPGLIQELRSSDYKKWQAASTQLIGLGARSVDPLLTCVRQGLTAEEHSPMSNAAVRAVRILGRIGPAAQIAVAPLRKLVIGSPSRLQSATILTLGHLARYASTEERAHVRATMIKLVTKDPNHANAHYRYLAQTNQEAFRTFARTQLASKPTTGETMAALSSSNPFLREFAAEVLANQRPEKDETTVARLAAMLAEQHPGKAGMPKDGEETPGKGLTIQVFNDRRIQFQVARALVRIAPADDRSIPAYRILLTRPVSKVRQEAILAVRKIGTRGAKLMPTLVPMIRSEIGQIRRDVITTIGMIGPGAKDAIPKLERLLHTADQRLVKRSKAALDNIRKNRP